MNTAERYHRSGRPLDSFEEREIQMEILKAIDIFCNKHSIRYFLMYGSLLGAVRHQGYIPWDDDIDIAMPRSDYEIFIKSFQHTNLQVYCLETDARCVYPYSKVCDISTEVYEGAFQKRSLYGVNIDIFPIDVVPDSKILQHLILIFLWVLRKILKIKLARIGPMMTFIQNNVIGIGKLLLFPIPIHLIASSINKIAKRYRDCTSMYAGCLAWGYGKREVLDKAIFESSVMLQFEILTIPAPAGYHQLLSSLYNDYSQLPPLNQRIAHHDKRVYLK